MPRNLSAEGLGTTAHGLRHEAMIDHYAGMSGGEAPPVRGGSPVPPDSDAAVRLSTAGLELPQLI